MVKKLEKTVQVAKETSELYDALVALLTAASAGKAAGLSGLALAGAITAAGLQPLVTALDGVSDVAEEHALELPEALMAHGVGGAQVGAAVAALVKAAKAPAPVVGA